MADFVITAAQECHPDWQLSEEMSDVLRIGCSEIDEEYLNNDLDLDASVDDYGNCVITLRDPKNGDRLKTWIMEGVFIIE